MKKIIRVITEDFICVKKRERKIFKDLHFCCKWHYAELLPDKKEVITSYNELIEKGYYDAWSTQSKRDKRLYGERYSYLFDRNSHEIRFSDREFVSYELSEYHYEEDDYTLEQLMRELPADEMIEYLKDNGLNVCPITR